MNMQKVVGMLIMVMVAILIIPMIQRAINPPPPMEVTYEISMTNYNTPDEVNIEELYNWFTYWYSQDNFSHYTVTFDTTTIELKRIEYVTSLAIKELYLSQVGEENYFIFGLNIYPMVSNTINFSVDNIAPSYPNTFTFTVVFNI